jgi:hypothetical protein
MDVRSGVAETSLYKRIGGYDVIAAIVDDLFALLRADARFSRFGMVAASILTGVLASYS